MSKVIPLTEPPLIVEVVKELESQIDNVTEAVLIYRVGPTTEDEKGRIHRYWFGEGSTMMCLGLARHMVDVIADWIREDNYLLDDEFEDGN